ncbi:hypothetical protein RhiJN_04092 [Ceratobasidium sp. AG-Ba]|nr:hypothetical protein RhiJN_04092 [Ceratobasidium sp. AG-Ba]QRW04985.1 hypothetical protein RhiLY_03984 [Ceratobasidium sp. AG-Ba]
MDSSPVEVDPAQIDIDLGHIHVRDPATREILRRQMEKGNITHTDITTLQRYQQSWDYSRIGLLGGALTTSVWGRFIRQPPLPVGRLFGLSTLAAFVGASLGTGFQVRAGIQAVNSLENPDRFKKALVEMSQELLAQRQAALRRITGSQQPGNAVQSGEETKLADSWDNRSRQSSPAAAPVTPGHLAKGAPSGDRWSQLRAQKPTAQPTAWDTIRQTHEPSSPSPSTQNEPMIESDEDKRRRQAQAEFDALLERERKMGQDNTPELKSRW